MISRNIFGFSVAPHMRRVLAVNGCYASIMKADKKKEKDDMGLPSGIPIPCLPVDFLKDRPDSWVGGQGSYVVPVSSDWGLWFNFSMNAFDTISVLSSIKGMNPLTGARVSGYELEKYTDKCPIHKESFKHGRFCSECNFKWPEQNYLSAPNAPYIDGFRTPEGVVRQFYFTEDLAKSVPELVIGKEDTVPAFGFCFYRLKNMPSKWAEGERLKNKYPEGISSGGVMSRVPGFDRFTFPGVYASEIPAVNLDMSDGDSGKWEKGLRGMSGPHGLAGTKGISGKSGSAIRYKAISESKTSGSLSMDSLGESAVYMCASAAASSLTPDMTISNTSSVDGTISAAAVNYMDTERSTGKHVKLGKMSLSRTAEVGVGAGAKISQSFKGDGRELSEWQKKPAGVIRLYFVFQEQFEKYASAGYNDLFGEKEGYLAGVPVGGAK